MSPSMLRQDVVGAANDAQEPGGGSWLTNVIAGQPQNQLTEAEIQPYDSSRRS